MRVILRSFVIMSAVLLLLFASVCEASGSMTWEKRLELARNKYNEKTVNIYTNKHGRYKGGKINVCYFPSKDKSYVLINIHESLKITDEAEMEAILEVIAKDSNFSAEEYGSIAFMKAQWIAHNIAHSMATGSEEQRKLVEAISGENLSEIIGSSEELDLSPCWSIPERQKILYEIIEFIYRLNGI